MAKDTNKFNSFYKIENIKPIKVVLAESVVTSNLSTNDTNQVIKHLFDYVKSKNAVRKEAPFCFFHMFTKEFFQTSMAINEEVELEDFEDIKIQLSYSGEALTTTFVGTIKDVQNEYIKLYDYARKNKIKLTKKVGEMYLTNPKDVKNGVQSIKIMCFIDE